MVSIMLLTTEEVLQRNGFWHVLDSVWITQEMEPFEEIRPEQVFVKPLPRDVYYARYPDIPRSESEDEASLTVKGFRNKHQEWKSKINIRKFDSQVRNNSTFSAKSINNNSTVHVSKMTQVKNVSKDFDNERRVSDFFRRLIESIPPPPVQEEEEEEEDIDCIDIPDYAEFENDRILLNSDDNPGPLTSTLKRSKCPTNLSFNSIKSDCDQAEWYETIYGVSELCDPQENSYNTSKVAADSDLISWSDIIDMCGLSESIIQSNEGTENLISQSHVIDDDISNISDDDDEAAYAKFSINKLKQTLKSKGKIQDSSSIVKLNYENDEFLRSIVKINQSLCKTFYQLTLLDDFEDSPPENELQKNSDRVLSEHELRVQRSLQKLNVPEW